MTRDDRPPRLRLIRVFLSLVVGFMAGLVGWMVVTMTVMFSQAPTASGRLPALLQVAAFAGPAVIAAWRLYAALGASRG